MDQVSKTEDIKTVDVQSNRNWRKLAIMSAIIAVVTGGFAYHRCGYWRVCISPLDAEV